MRGQMDEGMGGKMDGRIGAWLDGGMCWSESRNEWVIG